MGDLKYPLSMECGIRTLCFRGLNKGRLKIPRLPKAKDA